MTYIVSSGALNSTHSLTIPRLGSLLISVMFPAVDFLLIFIDSVPLHSIETHLTDAGDIYIVGLANHLQVCILMY